MFFQPYAINYISSNNYVLSPHRSPSPIIAMQNLSISVNVINDGSPSRIRMVRRISLGMTTRPKSSMRLTMPVAFKQVPSYALVWNSVLVSAGIPIVCKKGGMEVYGEIFGAPGHAVLTCRRTVRTRKPLPDFARALSLWNKYPAVCV